MLKRIICKKCGAKFPIKIGNKNNYWYKRARCPRCGTINTFLVTEKKTKFAVRTSEPPFLNFNVASAQLRQLFFGFTKFRFCDKLKMLPPSSRGLGHLLLRQKIRGFESRRRHKTKKRLLISLFFVRIE